MNLRVLANALNAKYALEPSYALHMAELAYLVKQGKLPLDKETFEITGAVPSVYSVQNSEDPEQVGNVSVIPVEGPIFRDDQFCGPMGTQSLGAILKGYDQNEDIVAHVIKMHTPGGQVEGTEIFANIIANTEKPVIVWGEDILSAGKYLAAGASHIMLSGKNARVGSIGVQVSYLNFKGALEKAGIEEVQIRATTSPDKNKFDYFNMSEEDKQAFAIEELDPIDSHFMDHVREHRPGVEEEALTGNVYFAEDAIEMGLADSIGSFEDAIALAVEMSGVFTVSSNQNSITMKDKQTLTANEEAAAVKLVNKDLQEKLDLAEKSLEEKDQVIKTQLELIEKLQGEKESLREVHADNEAEIGRLKKKVETLSKLPAGNPGEEEVAATTDATDKLDNSEPTQPVPEDVKKAIAAGKKRREWVERNKKN